MQSVKILKWLTWAVCLAIFMVFGIRNLREPDIWWIIRTGEWIVQNHHVPLKDVFSYTLTGSNWINVKWLYEVIAYLLQKSGGPEIIPVIQVIANLFFFILIFGIYNILRKIKGEKDFSPTPGFIIASLIAASGIEFRMTGRPEMISHLFTLIYFYIFLRFSIKPGKFIFWLIPLQLLWTNMHEAFGNGMIIIIVYLAAYIFDKKFIFKSDNKTAPKSNLLYFTAPLALLSVCVNPRGAVMLVHPFEIFSQLNVNKYTTELLSMYSGWFAYKKEIIIAQSVFVTGLFAFFRKEKNDQPGFIFRPLRKFGSFYFIFFILFFYLAFTAVRNIPFFILCYMPLQAYLIDDLISLKSKKGNTLKTGYQLKFYGLMIIISIFIYISIIFNFYYKNFNSRENYGLRIAEAKNPVGIAGFIKTNQIHGTCFSDYLVSSYLMWQLRPEFKTFIDLRDLDVFPPAFFDNFTQAVFIPSKFERADKKYHFDYVVLYRLNFFNLQRYLVSNPKWKFVYADAVSLCYTKNTVNDTSAERNSGDVFHVAQEPAVSKIAFIISKIFNPFYTRQTRSAVDYDLIASDVYYNLGKFGLALKYAGISCLKGNNNADAQARKGDIYLTLSENTGKAGYIDSAGIAYSYALKNDPSNPSANRGMAVIDIENQDFKRAEKHLLKAKRKFNDDINIYRMLARCEFAYSQQYSSKFEYYQKKWLKYLEKAYYVNPSDPMTRFELGTYYSGLNQCSKAKKYLNNLGYFEGISEMEKQKLRFSKQNCGIE